MSGEAQAVTDNDNGNDNAEEEEAPDLTSERGGFKAITRVDVLTEFFDNFDTMLDEMKLRINRDGLSGLGVDPANVGFVGDEIDEEAFEHYSSTGGVIGLDISRIQDILSLGDAGDLVEMELDQETRKLEIQIDGLEYTLALIDPASIRQEPDIPDLDLPASITLEGTDLNRAIKAADMVSDHIRFRIGETEDGEDAFFVEAEGDTDDVVLELTEDDLIDIEPGAAESLFSLDYMKDFSKAIPNDAVVKMKLGEEFPVEMAYEHIQVDDEMHGKAMMMLAPRIQSD